MSNQPKTTNQLLSTSIEGMVDASHAVDKDTLRSTTEYVLTMAGAPISWQSQLQPSEALLWLTIKTRPDIMYADSHVAKFALNPGRKH